MRSIIDRLLLMTICFCTVFFINIDTVFILAFFLSLIATCLNYYIDNRRFRLISVIIYIILTHFFPPFLLFLPVISYDLFLSRYYLLLIPYLVEALLSVNHYSLVCLPFMLITAAVAGYLSYQSTAYNELYEKFLKNRDDGIELNLVLKEKNQSILENQDYEIYTATLKERNRIAREIHDNVGHLLSRSILMTGALKTVNQDEQLTQHLEMLDETLNSAMTTIRTSVHDLHDNSVNLKASLEDIISSFDFCDVKLEYDMRLDVPSEIKYSFISITKEGLANIMKHSNADQVHILVREHPSMYQLILEDNGTGIKTSKDPGIGLLNMQERVRNLNGNLLIETNSGFRIFISVPKQ